MKWSDQGRSSNLEDRRGGGGGRMGMGIGGTAVLLVLSLLFGRNLFDEQHVYRRDPSNSLPGAPTTSVTTGSVNNIGTQPLAGLTPRSR